MSLRDEYVYLDEVVDGVRVKVITAVVGEGGKWTLSDDLIRRAIDQHQARLQAEFAERDTE